MDDELRPAKNATTVHCGVRLVLRTIFLEMATQRLMEKKNTSAAVKFWSFIGAKLHSGLVNNILYSKQAHLRIREWKYSSIHS